MRAITIQIAAGTLRCNDCEYLRIFSTGMVGETHPLCAIFGATGDWGGDDMKRAKECLKAEKEAAKCK